MMEWYEGERPCVARAGGLRRACARGGNPSWRAAMPTAAPALIQETHVYPQNNSPAGLLSRDSVARSRGTKRKGARGRAERLPSGPVSLGRCGAGGVWQAVVRSQTADTLTPKPPAGLAPHDSVARSCGTKREGTCGRAERLRSCCADPTERCASYFSCALTRSSNGDGAAVKSRSRGMLFPHLSALRLQRPQPAAYRAGSPRARISRTNRRPCFASPSATGAAHAPGAQAARCSSPDARKRDRRAAALADFGRLARTGIPPSQPGSSPTLNILPVR